MGIKEEARALSVPMLRPPALAGLAGEAAPPGLSGLRNETRPCPVQQHAHTFAVFHTCQGTPAAQCYGRVVYK